MIKVLVVDDDAGLRLSVKNTLESIDNKFTVHEAIDGLDAIEKVKTNNYRLVLLDVDMPRLSGLDALIQIKDFDPSIIALVLTAFANIDDAIKAVKEGAYNYVSKPIDSQSLLDIIEKALEAHSLISDIAASSPTLKMESERQIIGHTTEMKKVFHIINRLSKVDTPVLIRGASGTGKELVARAIHHNSSYKDGPFVAINCSAIPENLFESELFGHEKGSFTGADQRKIGKFQYAEGGTLFLDELGDMPPLMQVKLLRVLQEKVFSPVGSNREIRTNVRIIAATNRPLEDYMSKGKFREDLYYRLNVMPIFLPSLSERTQDIKTISYSFLNKFNKKHNKNIKCISNKSLELFENYNWPGNIRELENVIEHAFILEETDRIELSSLPENLLNFSGIELVTIDSDQTLNKKEMDELNSNEENTDFEIDTSLLDFNKQKEEFEKSFIIKALKQFNGKINQTALNANIPKKTLLRKIEKYNIIAKDYKD